MALVKNPVTSCSDIEKSFSDLLIPYAFEYVKKQLSMKCKVVTEKETDAGFIVSSHEGTVHFYYVLLFASLIGTLDVTCDICPCKFATTMQLPCRHILAVREKKGFFHCFQKLVWLTDGRLHTCRKCSMVNVMILLQQQMNPTRPGKV